MSPWGGSGEPPLCPRPLMDSKPEGRELGQAAWEVCLGMGQIKGTEAGRARVASEASGRSRKEQ